MSISADFNYGGASIVLAYNVLQIPEEGDFGTQNFKLTMNLNRRTILDITAKTPFLGMCCYKPFFFTNSILYEIKTQN